MRGRLAFGELRELLSDQGEELAEQGEQLDTLDLDIASKAPINNPIFTGNVTITGGNISGIADLAVADGGTGASTAADARTNLGLGSIATQAASAVSITGGTLSGISAAGFTLGSGNFVVTTTGTHLRCQNGSEIGLIGLQSTGQLDIWAHGDNATDLVRLLTGSGSGTVRGVFGLTGLQVTGSVKPSSYTVATLPSASSHGAGAQIYVSNETGGAVPAFSDGTNWRRVTDRAVVA